MHTKAQMLAALQLAIDDHKAAAGKLVDWEFVSELRDAMRVMAAAPETAIPVALVEVA